MSSYYVDVYDIHLTDGFTLDGAVGDHLASGPRGELEVSNAEQKFRQVPHMNAAAFHKIPGLARTDGGHDPRTVG